MEYLLTIKKEGVKIYTDKCSNPVNAEKIVKDILDTPELNWWYNALHEGVYCFKNNCYITIIGVA